MNCPCGKPHHILGDTHGNYYCPMVNRWYRFNPERPKRKKKRGVQ